MKLIIQRWRDRATHRACYTVIIARGVMLASSGLVCGLDNCSQLREEGRVGVRLTLPGDATASRWNGNRSLPS